MTISMKDLFSRRGIEDEVISLRNSLGNHHEGLQLSLREAHSRFLTPTSGDGYRRGCRHSDEAWIDYKVGKRKLGEVLPSWVSADDHDTRTVEGILTRSKISPSDFPFKPWHESYDWNFHVRVDKQYTYLLSESNRDDHGNDFECEWESKFFPSWAWPQEGSRIWMVGRWIYDCGHPGNRGHKTEIHPPKAVVSFRSEAVMLPGNPGPSRANNAVVYIGRRGGYWNQRINDQDYAFDLYLPPRPNAQAKPLWTVTSMTGPLQVEPRIQQFPGVPRALRVVIPLRDVHPEPDQYGVIIAGGWTDVEGTEAKQIMRVRVTVHEILIDVTKDGREGIDNLNPFASGDLGEWYLKIGINGRWQIYDSLEQRSTKRPHSVILDLHPSDRICITASGMEADDINRLMGWDTGLSWRDIEDADQATKAANKIRDGFRKLGDDLLEGKDIENDSIGAVSVAHAAHERGKDLVAISDESDYRIRYSIESV